MMNKPTPPQKPAFKPQRKWKYAKPQKQFTFEEYLNLPINEKHVLVIRGWMFPEQTSEDGGVQTVLRADVASFDGAPLDKIVVIKEYATVQKIKKAVSKKKSIKDTFSMEITRRYNEDKMEYTYDVVFL